MTDIDDQDEQLGSKSKWDDMIYWPKLYTNHYNINGLNIYKSKLTVVVFITVVIYSLLMFSFRLFPLIMAKDDWYVSEELKT